MSAPRPPLAARWLGRALLGRDDFRAVESDLAELYERRRARDGERAAGAWLRRQWRQYPIRLIGLRRRPGRSPRPAGLGDRDRRLERRGGTMRDLGSDLRQSLRGLGRRPGLAATIVLTVGLGIGATTTVFGVVHAVLVAPLPYEDPDRLVRLYTDAPPNRFRFSVADWLALAEQQTSFTEVAGYTGATFTFTRGREAERVQGKLVTGGYFSVLGIGARRGRVLAAADDHPGAPPTAVVSAGFAERWLGGADAALGESIRLDGADHTVVGVLAAEVGPLEQGRDLFLPARWQTPPRKGPFFVTAIGRLRREVDRAAAGAELAAINRRIFPVWQASYQDEKATWAAMGLAQHVVGDVGRTLALVLGAVGFVLLVASANAANLLVARAAQRRRELAVRGALGASRGRLVRHLLVESALLAAGAALAGLGLAAALLRLFAAAGAAYVPRAAEVGLSAAALAFLAAVALGAGLLFGLVPALAGARARVEGALGAGGRSATDAAGARRLRQALVGAQFAVATPLLVAAALLLASLANLRRVDPGFAPENLLTAAVLLPAESYSDPVAVRAFWERAQRAIEALPGVEGVAFADGRPPREVFNVNNFDLEDEPTPPGESEPTAP
jgi:predicted permease